MAGVPYPVTDQVLAVLRAAEMAGVMDILGDWAEWIGWAKPESPEEVLMWMEAVIEEEEAAVQETTDAEEIQESQERMRLLGSFADRLRDLGVSAPLPPWMKRRKRWGF